MSIINWTQYRPATRVNNFRGTYLELPAFSLDTGIVWKGASEVVMQFNYSAAKDFVLLNRPAKPTGCNFGLCIRYRVGDTVTRYKLWEDDAFILSGVAAPLYSGERIRANFVLEIWSFKALTEVSLDTAIQMTTSVRNNITSLTARSVESFATGAEFVDLYSTAGASNPPLIGSLLMGWYRPDDFGIVVDGPTSVPGPLTNASTVGNMTDLSDSLGTSPNIYAGANALNGHAWIRFDGVNNYMESDLAGGVQSHSVDIFFVARIYNATTTSGGWILGASDSGAGAADKVIHDINTVVAASKADGSNYNLTVIDLGVNEWRICRLSIDRTNDICELAAEGFTPNEVTTGNVNTSATKFVMGQDIDFPGVSPGRFDFAEVLVFDGLVSDANATLAYQYLGKKFFNAIPLPMTFNTGGPWEDNDEL